jgi:hypothetical protein
MPYLLAKVRTRSKYLHSAIILPDEREGGVHLYILTKHGDQLFPFGSSWHETEDAAKADALDSMKIRASDWVSHDGEPSWASDVAKAIDNAICRYAGAVTNPLDEHAGPTPPTD